MIELPEAVGIADQINATVEGRRIAPPQGGVPGRGDLHLPGLPEGLTPPSPAPLPRGGEGEDLMHRKDAEEPRNRFTTTTQQTRRTPRDLRFQEEP